MKTPAPNKWENTLSTEAIASFAGLRECTARAVAAATRTPVTLEQALTQVLPLGPEERGRITPLRWHPFPCEICCAANGIEAVRFNRALTPEGQIESQMRLIKEWAEWCPHRPTNMVEALLPVMSRGSEHEVFLNAETGNVIKLTLPQGIYGDIYSVEDGRICQRETMPLEYLDRLPLWGNSFGGCAPDILGFTDDGRFVTEMPFVRGVRSTQDDVDAFLESHGWEPVNQRAFVWKKRLPPQGDELWVGDIRGDNCVTTQDGTVVPIDIRLWKIRAKS